MKAFVLGSVLVFLGFFCGIAVHAMLGAGGSPAVAADCQDDPCPKPPCCNGDVNGDGAIDVSDAVTLLTYLFAKGPEPIEIERASHLFPSTGQKTCYDQYGNDISCAGEEYPGQDGFYHRGCRMEGRFVDNGDDTVTDNCTGLMWQQAPADKDGDGNADLYTWQEALNYSESLILCKDNTWTTSKAEAEKYGGIKYDNWRLPNIRELLSIVDYSRHHPSLNPVFIVVSSPRGAEYWSSTSDDRDPEDALTLFPLFGSAGSELKVHFLYVRCVRSLID